MASRTSTSKLRPVTFGRERPYDFSCIEELFEAPYAPPPGRAIYMACGNGRTAIEVAGHGMKVLGIDPDRDVLSAARERAVLAGVELDFMAGDPLQLPPLPEESFALVVDLATAAQLPEGTVREEYFRDFQRILMREGVLCCATDVPPRRRRKTRARAFTFAGSFLSDLRRAGFEVLFEGERNTPPGDRKLLVHARKRV
jgi:ubiquinone/menaquinone biosynthesis C-methylase UbiE